MSVEPHTPQTADDPTRTQPGAPTADGPPTGDPSAATAEAGAKDGKAKDQAKGKDKAKVKEKKVPKDLPPPEPKVVGETRYDKVSSAMMAWVIGVGGVVAWIGLMVWTQQGFADIPPPPVEIIEVEGGGGGTPDGDMGATQEVNVSGAEAADMASNNMEDASAFEEPTIEMTTSAVIDALADVDPDEMTDVDIAEALPNAQMVATGKKASKIGNGNPFGYGPGPGGGVPREQRWSLVFNPGQTTEQYAQQLDALKIELATLEPPNSVIYGSNFSSAGPIRRTGLSAADDRLFFIWQGAGRKGADVSLLARAGIVVANRPVLQFIPKPLEDQMAQLEYHFKNRQPAQIRKTRFQVVAQSGRYVVKVLSQEPLAQP